MSRQSGCCPFRWVGRVLDGGDFHIFTHTHCQACRRIFRSFNPLGLQPTHTLPYLAPYCRWHPPSLLTLDLLRVMLSADPAKRPGLREIVDHFHTHTVKLAGEPLKSSFPLHRNQIMYALCPLLQVASSLSPEALDLLRLMLSADPAKRPGLREILDHPWCRVDFPPGALDMNKTCLAIVDYSDIQSEAEILSIIDQVSGQRG